MKSILIALGKATLAFLGVLCGITLAMASYTFLIQLIVSHPEISTIVATLFFALPIFVGLFGYFYFKKGK